MYPRAPTNCSSALKSVYHCHDNIKKRAYKSEVQHGTFTTLIFSTTGGMANQAIVL